MSLNPQLVLMPSLQQQLWSSLTNSPLAAGTVYFYEDSDKTTPKNVYELTGDNEGNYGYASLGAVLTLSGIGTFVDETGKNLIPYMYPYTGLPTDPVPSTIVDLYYIKVYDVNNVFQFDINAWPNLTQESGPINTASTTENILANPQFVEVSFPSSYTSANPLTVNASGTGVANQIAPDWWMVTNGTGSFQVYQNPLADTTTPGNAAYSLVIVTSTGFSGPMLLRQRLLTPRILAGSYVSGTFAVNSLDLTAHSLTMSYVPSVTGTPLTICSGTTLTTGWTTIANATAVLVTPANTGEIPTSYIDITISIPVGANLQITSIQLAGVASSAESVNYLQETTERQRDHLFHYYEDAVVMQPKPSLLTGWKFGLNPWQFNTKTFTNVAVNQYTADQTVIVQQKYVASGTQNNVAAGSTLSLNVGYPFQIKAVTTTSQFAMIQYIDASTTYPYWGLTLSSLVNALITTVNSTTCRIKMRLIWSTTAPATISQTEPIASWTAGSDPVFSSNWGSGTGGVIIPENDPVYTLAATFGSFTFEGMQLPTITASTMYLAIVLYTLDPLSITTTADIVSVSNISLVRNDFALDAQPQTADQVLKECQFYYEQSAPTLAAITGGTSYNALYLPMSCSTPHGSSNVYAWSTPFGIVYKNTKRKTPTVGIYSINGTANYVTSVVNYTTNVPAFIAVANDVVLATYWTASANVNSVIYSTTTNTALQSFSNGSASSGVGDFVSSGILFQYTLDARLGLV